MLDFVDTPMRNVVLEPLGKKVASVSPEERRELFRQALLRLRLFREVRGMIERSEKRGVEADLVYEVLAINLPNENYESLFETLVRWGRFGELFTYDENTKRLALPEAS
jgi:NitT/TauT family transport system ATP-binding protein